LAQVFLFSPRPASTCGLWCGSKCTSWTAPKMRRRSSALASVLAVGALAAFSASFAFLFAGQAPRGAVVQSTTSGLTALEAVKAGKKKKQKQRLSLAEALEREKKEKEALAKGEVEKRDVAKLSPEQTFWEGPPSSTECFIPFLSCFVVLGIVPFIAAVNRQFRVKYKITDRRISVTSGWDGKDVTEFSYAEIAEMKFGLRYFGYCADLRINLRDGAKVEVFGLLNFFDNYRYIYSRIEKDARKKSDKPPRE